MMRRTEQFYKKVLNISDEELVRELLCCTKISRKQGGTILLHTGDLQNQIHFLLSGFCRGYFIDEGGNDITDCFVHRVGEPVVAVNALNGPSPISIEILETTEIISIPVKDMNDLMERYPVLYQLKAQLLQEALCQHWEAKRVLYQYTALQRYQWFCSAYPGVIDRVKHSCVASFLHMTPVTLSRLRRQLRENMAEGITFENTAQACEQARKRVL